MREIKQYYKELKIRFVFKNSIYTLTSSSTKFLGGWLQIGRVVTNATNINSYSLESVMSSNFSDLHKAESQNFLLNGRKFSDLKSLIGFTEYRVYCTKQYHGRTNNAKFTSTNPNGIQLFNYITQATSPAPSNLCNALVYMPDDNSRFRNVSCTSRKPQEGPMPSRLYDPWYVHDVLYISTTFNLLMECDDNKYAGRDKGYNNYGTWMFYVR